MCSINLQLHFMCFSVWVVHSKGLCTVSSFSNSTGWKQTIKMECFKPFYSCMYLFKKYLHMFNKVYFICFNSRLNQKTLGVKKDKSDQSQSVILTSLFKTRHHIRVTYYHVRQYRIFTYDSNISNLLPSSLLRFEKWQIDKDWIF